ncbi:MAG: FAD binding domain-containing protein [Xanthobacteraceae bacterium]
MTPFELLKPRSLAEAIAALDPEEPGVRAVAGGTALMLIMKAGLFQPTRLVSLERIEPRYAGIELTAGGDLRIGAMASLTALEHAESVAAHFPVITRTLRSLSNVRIRNVARVGGALAHGDPHMDLPPLFAALGAQVAIVGPKGTRELPVQELYAGYYETTLARDELIAEVIVPAMRERSAAYVKVTTRTADDWPALGIAVSLGLDHGILRDVKIVASAATEKVTRLKAAEKLLENATVSEPLLLQAGEAAAGEVAVMADAHGSASYKKELLRVTVRRAVQQALTSRRSR